MRKIVKHVPSSNHVNKIIEEEKAKDNFVSYSARSCHLILKDKEIFFIIWYNLDKVHSHVGGPLGTGAEIDITAIESELELIKKRLNMRRSLILSLSGNSGGKGLSVSDAGDLDSSKWGFKGEVDAKKIYWWDPRDWIPSFFTAK